MKHNNHNYHKISLIGEGSSGKIYKIVHKDTKQVYAAKIIPIESNQEELEAIETQVNIMNDCNHPNIIKCYGVELYSSEVWIIMEYCENGSLADIMREQKATFNEEQISSIVSQTLKGMQYLHSRRIIHRDIKASNLLYLNGTVKIADFGVAIAGEGKKDKENKHTKVGSPFWMSPELLSEALYSPKSDIWALGITAIELAQGQPPYSHQHPYRAIFSIQTNPPQSLSNQTQWSNQFNNFVKKCLTLDSQTRPTAQQLLQHSFITRVQANASKQSSPEQYSQQNTIILHEEEPKSLWQKGSFPQTEEKLLSSCQQQLQNTIIINDSAPSDIYLFSNVKKSLQDENHSPNRSKHLKDKQNIKINRQANSRDEQRQAKIKELYQMMEDDIKSIRRKYMAKIRQLYNGNTSQQRKWQSPLNRLKEKNNQSIRKDHCRFSSEILKKML